MKRQQITLQRSGEYFDPNELRKLSGLDPDDWSRGIAKELLDNALDAAETAGVPPMVSLELAVTGDDEGIITVTDNGAGLPPELVSRIINFSTKTSDKVRYCTPTRGAQGNALKTVLGFAYCDAEGRPVVIESCGQRHRLTPSLDSVEAAQVDHETEACDETVGTLVSVPITGGGYDEWWEDLGENLRALVRRFALFNPHAEIHFDGETFGPAGPEYEKPRPSDPGCPHWLGVGDFGALLGALQVNRPDMPVREFAGLFRGGSRKGKVLRDAIGGVRTIGEVDGQAEALWEALRENVRAASVKQLGPLGEALKKTVAATYDTNPVVPMEHKQVTGSFEHQGAEIPFALDMVFALLADDSEDGGAVFGVNNSPTYRNPFGGGMHQYRKETARHTWSDWSFEQFLSSFHVNLRSGSFLVAVHLNCPNLKFTDYAKTSLESGPFVEALTEATYQTCKGWWEVRHKEQRDEKRAANAYEEQRRERKRRLWPVKEAVLEVLDAAIAKTSHGGEIVFPERNLYYVVRDMLNRYDVDWSRTKEGRLRYDYFESVITDFENEQRRIPGMYREARGKLIEPHTGTRMGVGTLEVDAYTPPEWTFDKVLFVEKQGFNPYFAQRQLAERYDMAILSCQGFGTEAAKDLMQVLKDLGACTLLCIHDADKAGYEIARTLQEETRRSKVALDIIDLGLTYHEAMRLGLSSEEVTYQYRPSGELIERTERGELTDKEFEWLTGWAIDDPRLRRKGRRTVDAYRVELNAFDLPDLVDWIEAKLREVGVTEKVLPNANAVMERAKSMARDYAEEQAERIISELLNLPTCERKLADAIMTGTAIQDFRPGLEATLKDNPPVLWSDLLRARARSAVSRVAQVSGYRNKARKLIAEAVEVLA